MSLALSSAAFEPPAGTTGGRPLVVLHGLFASSSNWRTIARRLSPRRPVICLDARNHGTSPHDPNMDYPAQSGDVARFIEDQRLGRVDVLGHSMGGKTAMVLALRRPELVAKLLVADIAPVPNKHSFSPLIDALRGVDLTRVNRRSDAEDMLKHMVGDAALRQFLLQNLTSKTGSFEWRINLDAIESSLDEILTFDPRWAEQPFAGPVLFLRGENSDYIRDDHRDVIKGYFPGAQIHTLRNAGHWLHAEQPDAFVDEVQAFLDV